MKMHALSIGSAVQEFIKANSLCGAKVHSVFHRTVNLVLPGGRIVACSCGCVPQHPANITTSFACDDAALHDHVQLNALVVVERQALRVGSLEIDLQGAATYVPTDWKAIRLCTSMDWAAHLPACVDEASCTLGSIGLGVLLPFLRTSLPRSDVTSPHAEPLLRLVWQQLGLLADALRQNEAMLPSARRLIGLGPGLTPAGDDLLAGVLASMFAVSAAGRQLSPALDKLRLGLYEESHGLTPDLSREMLYYASKGQLTAVAEDVLSCMLQGKPLADSPSVSAMARYGATSGADQFVGLVVGLRLIQQGCRWGWEQ
ncbi:MAG: hypothetical protein DDT39_00673 [Firmicutes bacterium]|nr:hypothetical protein [candidate division NPL-UPA2 bacterium]